MRSFITVIPFAAIALSLQVAEARPKNHVIEKDLTHGVERGVVDPSAFLYAGSQTPNFRYAFESPRNFSLYSGDNDSFIEAVIARNENGELCTNKRLMGVLSGLFHNDSQGRVPVVYEAQLQDYNISQLQLADYNNNDPNGMKPVRFYETHEMDINGNKSWIGYVGLLQRDMEIFGDTNYWEESHPEFEGSELTVIACGKFEHFSGEPFGGSLFVVNPVMGIKGLFGGNLSSDLAAHYWKFYSAPANTALETQLYNATGKEVEPLVFQPWCYQLTDNTPK